MKSLNQQQARHIHIAGFTLWLDPEGSDNKIFGIRIPRRELRPGEWADDGGEVINNGTDDIEILQNGEEKPVTMDPAQLREIQLGTSSSRNGIMFEFRVPLSVKMENGSKVELKNKYIGIGFESGKIEMPHKENEKPEGREMRGEGFPEEMNGDGERPEGGRGGRRSREDFKSGKRAGPIDFWFKISLSPTKL